MAIFREIVRMWFKVFIHYKWGFLITLFIQPILMLVNLALFGSIYRNSGVNSVLGYDLAQIVWYYTAVNFVFVFIWNFTHTRLSERIISGDLTMDLVRPFSVYGFELGNAMGLRIAGVILEFLPAIFLYSLIVFPSFLRPESLLRFFVSIVIAFFLYYNLSFLIGLLAFAVKNSTTIIAIKEVVITSLGGVFIPLAFFPPALNAVLDWLPFKYIFHWPIQFFLNRPPADDWIIFLRVVGVQIAWTAALYLACRLLWKVAVRKFSSAGG